MAVFARLAPLCSSCCGFYVIKNSYIQMSEVADLLFRRRIGVQCLYLSCLSLLHEHGWRRARAEGCFHALVEASPGASLGTRVGNQGFAPWGCHLGCSTGKAARKAAGRVAGTHPTLKVLRARLKKQLLEAGHHHSCRRGSAARDACCTVCNKKFNKKLPSDLYFIFRQL